MRNVLTTGQVSKICNVAPRTVSKWYDSGRLQGYTIPGSKDRRIPVRHLIKFMKEHGIPLGELEAKAEELETELELTAESKIKNALFANRYYLQELITRDLREFPCNPEERNELINLLNTEK